MSNDRKLTPSSVFKNSWREEFVDLFIKLFLYNKRLQSPIRELNPGLTLIAVNAVDACAARQADRAATKSRTIMINLVANVDVPHLPAPNFIGFVIMLQHIFFDE